MSIRNKILAGAAALTLVSGVGAAGALSATAATPSCGPNCIDLFSKEFGTFHNPQFVLDTQRQGAKVGQPEILFRQSNADPAEDYTISLDGQVSDLFAAGQVGPQVMLHYGCLPGNQVTITGGQGGTVTCSASAVNDYAVEFEYSPYGVGSGLCLGVPSGVSGTKASLQPCGVNGGTAWIADTLDSCPSNPLFSAELPLINGLDANFSHPVVLTYPAAGYPTDNPRPQLKIANLTGFSQTGGTGSSATCGGSAVTGPSSDQLWSAKLGVLN